LVGERHSIARMVDATLAEYERALESTAGALSAPHGISHHLCAWRDGAPASRNRPARCTLGL
jgi:hypothetical protein